jgi:hypothetical protein
MDSLQQMSSDRHEYRIKVWQRWLLVLLAVGMAGGAAFFALVAKDASAGFLEAIMVLFFLGGGLYLAAYALRSRLVLDGSRIEVRGVFKESTADLSQIEGFRNISTRNGSYTLLYLKEGRGKITISQSFGTDDNYRAWFQKITDLDARDRDAILAEISQNAELGSTPEERLSALKQAKIRSYVATAVALAAAIALNVGPAPYRLPSAIVLALSPLAVLLLNQRSPLLYKLGGKKSDPRAELFFALLVAGFGMLFPTFEYEILSIQPLLLLIGLVALAYIAAFFNSARKNSSTAGALIGLLFVAGIYSYSLVVLTNTLMDRSKPTTYIVPVTGKHTTSGKSTTYYLELAPWGPIDHSNEISVASDFYNEMQTGDQVCLGLHAGRLHAAWYQLAECPAQSAPEQTP